MLLETFIGRDICFYLQSSKLRNAITAQINIADRRLTLQLT